MTPQPPFDPIQAERFELDTLLERGSYFTVPKRSMLRYIGNPDRRFVIQQPYLGTLDYLSREYMSMNFDESRIKENPLAESKRLFEKNPMLCARVVAIAVLNSRWPIKVFTSMLARYFLWRLTPATLIRLVMLINQVSNLGDFTNSIRFLSTNRTTTPALMEKPEIKRSNVVESKPA